MPKPIRRLTLAGADVKIYTSAASACEEAAHSISAAIEDGARLGKKVVLGLATGATPEPIYARLVEDHRERGLSFENVSTYNLDEYYPISPLDPRSYRSYMEQRLFAHVNLAPNRAHVLDGTVPDSFVKQHGEQFDRWILDEGGLDIQLLGIGRNGHIGFNEPSNLSVDRAVELPTRLVDLHPMTISDAAKDFDGEESVPRHALTMGVATILAARSILVLAFGERKAPAVARSLLGPITAEVPGSLLHTVSNKVTWLIDQAAASEILREV